MNNNDTLEQLQARKAENTRDVINVYQIGNYSKWDEFYLNIGTGDNQKAIRVKSYYKLDRLWD